MRGLVILSKDQKFFDVFVEEVKLLNTELYNETKIMIISIFEGSIKIDGEAGAYATFYDRRPTLYEDDVVGADIPSEVVALGYKYAFLVESRSSKLFCGFFKSFRDLDVLILDDQNGLFRPDELSPSTLSL